MYSILNSVHIGSRSIIHMLFLKLLLVLRNFVKIIWTKDKTGLLYTYGECETNIKTLFINDNYNTVNFE